MGGKGNGHWPALRATGKRCPFVLKKCVATAQKLCVIEQANRRDEPAEQLNIRHRDDEDK